MNPVHFLFMDIMPKQSKMYFNNTNTTLDLSDQFIKDKTFSLKRLTFNSNAF